MASPTQIGIATFAATPREVGLPRHYGFVAATGLLNTLIVSFLFLHLPASHAPSLPSLALRATLFVLIGAVAGTLGSWFYFRHSASPFRVNPTIPFRLIALSCAAAWVFVPAVVLLSRQDLLFTAPLAMIAAALLGMGLRWIVPTDLSPAAHEPAALFAATLETRPYELHGLLAAVCIYTATYALTKSWVMDASVLFAACALSFAWKLTQTAATATSREPIRRLVIAIPIAIVITLSTLLYGVGHRNHLEAIAAADVRARAAADALAEHAADDLSSYHSVILWPPPEKKQLVAPIPQPASILAPGDSKPLVIRFDGPYWYFQPPNHQPGPHAHQAHGTPLAVDIQTNNALSLIMEAHQALAAPIPLSRIREIQLGLLNRDNRAGMIKVALLLTDSTALPGVQVDLGQVPIASTDPAHFIIKSAAVAETLHFAVPAHAALRRFDGITVMFFPETANFNIGRKVAVEQFQLIPR